MGQMGLKVINIRSFALLILLVLLFIVHLPLHFSCFGNVEISDIKNRKKYKLTQGKSRSWDIQVGKQLIDQLRIFNQEPCCRPVLGIS